MSVSVGGEVDSKCGKCKDVTLHIVIAMVGDEVAKVECKRCKAQHRYRSPIPKAKKKKATKKKTTKKKTRRRGQVDPDAPPVPTVKANLDHPVMPYAMDARFEIGDRIAHKKFGEGIVEEIPADNKVLICFVDARRTLRHARQNKPTKWSSAS